MFYLKFKKYVSFRKINFSKMQLRWKKKLRGSIIIHPLHVLNRGEESLFGMLKKENITIF